MICFTPVLTYIVTVSPAFNSSFAAGSCLITYPASTLLLASSLTSTSNSSALIACSASSLDCPVTFGTIFIFSPLLSTSFTVEPSFTVYPSKYGGSCDTIFPASTSELNSSVISNTKFASVAVVSACSLVISTKFGSATSLVLPALSIACVPKKPTTGINITKSTIITIFNAGCFAKNALIFPFFFLPFSAFSSLSLALSLFIASSDIVSILCVYAISLEAVFTKSPSGSFNAIFKSLSISVAD